MVGSRYFTGPCKTISQYKSSTSLCFLCMCCTVDSFIGRIPPLSASSLSRNINVPFMLPLLTKFANDLAVCSALSSRTLFDNFDCLAVHFLKSLLTCRYYHKLHSSFMVLFLFTTLVLISAILSATTN